MGTGLQHWDRLAVASWRPLSAPAMVRAWWEHMRPADAELRLIAVWEGDELAGLAPLVRVGRRYSWAGGQVMSGEPLARPGREQALAEAVAAELTTTGPRPVSIELETFESSPSWSTLLCRAWPKPRMLLDRRHRVVSVPRVDLDEDGFDGWMRDRTSKFRRDIKRRRRRLEEAGGSLRITDLSSLRDDVAELLRLHLDRQREESVFGLPGATEMLVATGEALLPEGRFRLVCVDFDGKMIGGLLLYAAGPLWSAFVSGFDDEFAVYSPNLVSILRVIEEIGESGERCLSLGAGGQSYKYRFATGEEELARHYLVPVAPRSIGALARRAIGDRLREIGARRGDPARRPQTAGSAPTLQC